MSVTLGLNLPERHRRFCARFWTPTGGWRSDSEAGGETDIWIRTTIRAVFPRSWQTTEQIRGFVLVSYRVLFVQRHLVDVAAQCVSILRGQRRASGQHGDWLGDRRFFFF